MSLLNGKTHVAILQIEENPHQTLQELLHMAQNHIAAPIEAAEMTDETCGIAPGKLLLGRAITEQNSSVGNIAVLNLRRTAKRINSILQLNTRMNELYRLWETADMNERGEQELPHINGRE